MSLISAFGARAAERETMVARTIEARGVSDPATGRALRRVPRHAFVGPERQAEAYADCPLPIGHGQTISQPYVVAYMTAALHLTGRERVLEVGTGCGYQTAVLAELAARVYSLEIIGELAQAAAGRLAQLGYRNIDVYAVDGYQGWPAAAPYDAIVVAAAAPYLPAPLLAQLRDGGRLVIPVGEGVQELMLITRCGAAFSEHRTLAVSFVPMTGQVRQLPADDSRRGRV
jgi:protein-L-isoaspartate(D-aspartate) O-methyltransferase